MAISKVFRPHGLKIIEDAEEMDQDITSLQRRNLELEEQVTVLSRENRELRAIIARAGAHVERAARELMGARPSTSTTSDVGNSPVAGPSRRPHQDVVEGRPVDEAPLLQRLRSGYEIEGSLRLSERPRRTATRSRKRT